MSFNYIWCDILFEIINDNLFQEKVNYYFKKYNSKSKMYDIFFIYYKIFNELVMLNKNIERNINSILHKSNFIPYIGIQIRIGNEDLKERQFSYSNDTDLMIRLAKKYVKYKKWFLTGDSQRLKLKLSKIYKQIFVYTTNITKHYAYNKKDFTIIIEHEILSKSSMLFISKSSYGLTAALKSGLLINSNDILCYEIKNGKLYKTANEFYRFYN